MGVLDQWVFTKSDAPPYSVHRGTIASQGPMEELRGNRTPVASIADLAPNSGGAVAAGTAQLATSVYESVLTYGSVNATQRRLLWNTQTCLVH